MENITRKNIVHLLLCLMAVQLAGCSPKVITHVANERPPLPVDSVHIFLYGERIPSSAVMIGDVAVKDRGTTTKCNYDYVVQLGKEATAQHGGNALQIKEHREPSFKSSCHQIFGNMLYLNPAQMYSATTDTLALMPADDTFGAQVVYAMKRNNPKNVVKLSVGPSRITSKVYSPYGTVHKKMGLDVMLNYEHIGNRNFGFGFTTAFNRTTYGGMGNQTFFYIGPDLVISRVTTKNWRWDVGIGMGYTTYSETGGDSGGGFGALTRLGVEYAMSDHIAIGADWNLMTRTFSAPKDFHLEKNQRYGFDSMSLTAGMRFYF